MWIGRHKDYILHIAEQRLINHQDRPLHCSHYGDKIEKVGAAGEIVARLLLGLDLNLTTGLDGGIDFYWNGYICDAKGVWPLKAIEKNHLLVRENAKFVAEIYMLMAVDLIKWTGYFVGWAWREEVLAAPVDREAYQPCHSIIVTDLHTPRQFFELQPKTQTRP